MKSISMDWDSFKSIVSERALSPAAYKRTDSGIWLLWAELFGKTIQCELEEGSAEETDYLTNYQTKWTMAGIPGIDSDGNLRSSLQPRGGSSTTIISHNFGDPCTWYSNAVESVDEVLSTSDNITYTASHVNIIDIEHGRITFDSKIDPKYKAIVKKNGSVITSGYVIDYEQGKVVFNSANTTTDTITLSYYYATTSDFTIKPSTGKLLKIPLIEVQFSVNVSLLGKYEFQFEELGYDPNNLPNKMVYKTTLYRSIKNFIDESNNSLAKVLPAMGELTNDIISFVWEYQTYRPMIDSQGAELKIKLKDLSTGLFSTPLLDSSSNNIEICTMAMYCISEDE
jgi:hypothetical protein